MYKNYFEVRIEATKRLVKLCEMLNMPYEILRQFVNDESIYTISCIDDGIYLHPLADDKAELVLDLEETEACQVYFSFYDVHTDTLHCLFVGNDCDYWEWENEETENLSPPVYSINANSNFYTDMLNIYFENNDDNIQLYF